MVSLDNLLWISTNVTSWGCNFIQTADINAEATLGWNGGAGFSPIGNDVVHFTGSYNGQGNIIEQLCINRPSTNYVGLFGAIYEAEIEDIFFGYPYIQGNDMVGSVVGANYGNSTISNVIIHFGSVTGDADVGGVVGSNNSSTISLCRSSGTVTGNTRIGGVVGDNNSTSIVNKCSSTAQLIGGSIIAGVVGFNGFNSTVDQCSYDGNVSGGSDAAGLVGVNLNGSTVNNSHAAGTVVADYYAGGVVGSNLMGCLIYNCYSISYVDCDLYSGGLTGQNYGEAENSFWNIDTSGQISSGGGTGKTNAELKDVATFTAWVTIGLDEPWDFVWNPNDDTLNEDIWNIFGIYNDGFPILVWEDVTPPAGVQPTGAGTQEDPYQIATLDNLLWVSTNPDSWGKHLEQTADIDATATSSWNDGAGFSPIGNSVNPFTGNFNGNLYEIQNLFINRPSTDYVGLLGCTWGAYIADVDIQNCDIHGNNKVGGLVGENHQDSEIQYSKVEGSVTGQNDIGGVVGKNHSSDIDHSQFEGSVTGQNNVGGLAGYNYSSNLFAPRVIGSVAGTDNVGGIAGDNKSNSSINHASAQVNVNGADNVGGVIGMNEETSTIENSCASGFVNGEYKVGGFVGSNESSSSINKSYSTGYVQGNSEVGGFAGSNIGFIIDCFWDVDTSGQSDDRGGTGKTTVELKDVATYTDLSTIGLEEPWDFVGDPYDDTGDEDIWNIDGVYNEGYPFPAWEYTPPPPGPTNITITIDEDDVVISWDDMGASSYNVYRSVNPYSVDWGSQIGSTDVNSYTDLGAASENKYFYYITIPDTE